MKEMLRYVVLGGLFLLPLIPLLVTESLFFPYITGKNFTFRIIVEVIFGAWVILALLDAQYRPKVSWVLGAFAVFLGITFLANLFGEAPERSFWSNFERMEGWVTLAHLFLYVLVASSVLATERLWRSYFNVSLAAATCVSLYAFAQLFGFVTIMQGGVRIDATLGNAIYMAVYMLFHVFIALFLLVHERDMRVRLLYGALALIFAYLLIQTGTRGTTLGLIGGLVAGGGYLALFGGTHAVLRKYAIVGIVALVVIVGIFVAVKDTAYVREHPILSRLASISLEAGETRFTIWNMALEGAKERPLLGWGQGNFDFVFNKYYEPSLYAQEPWFDRVHEIFLDWLIAAGALGLLSYLILLLSLAYILIARTSRGEKDGDAFTHPERAVLIGLLAGYVIHNIFVFDNLISYFFFATLIALVHMRVGKAYRYIEKFSVRRTLIVHIIAPAVLVITCITVYMVNVPPILAAHDLGRALMLVSTAHRNTTLVPAQYNGLLREGFAEFTSALERDSFANQEIREQLALTAQNIYTNPNASAEVKDMYVARAETELNTHIAEHPNIARIHAFFGTFYRAIGQSDQALEQFEIALSLSPKKQRLLFDIGSVYLMEKRYTEALDVFKEAFELAPESRDARAFYIVAAIHANDEALIEELSQPPYDELYITHEAIVQAYYQLGRYDDAIELVTLQIERDPSDIQLRISKAVAEYHSGDVSAAVATIREAMDDFTGFDSQGKELIEIFETGALETPTR